MDEKEIEELIAEGHEGKYICPYCGKIHKELELCCGEMHSEQIVAKKEAEKKGDAGDEH